MDQCSRPVPHAAVAPVGQPGAVRTLALLLCFISQDGVNWLSFLNKYKLHGILCDDMGLGKTLQSICILAGDHYLRYYLTRMLS